MKKLWATALMLITITACSKEPPQSQKAVLLPAPMLHTDPSDVIAHQSLKTMIATLEAPQNSTYDLYRTDLDDDGRREAIALFKTPYGFWCGIHGCTMLIMQAHNDHFSLVNAVQPVREPIYIKEHTTNGWKDLLIRVSGRTEKAKNVALTYSGLKYPHTPANLPAIDEFAHIYATPAFNE
tara:strand:+ start:757 stop:1299 length:543 start_codon:yes stop_codon:yes gene_type:complete